MPVQNISNVLHTNISATPYPQALLAAPPWSSFLRHNGYQELSKELNLRILQDLDTIEALWEEFSPNRSVFDTWDVRKSFSDAYRFRPKAITIEKKQGKKRETVGVLPLWFNSDENPVGESKYCDCKKFVWFGSNWPEDNVFHVRDPELIPLLLIASPKPLELACIRYDPDYTFLQEFPGFSDEEEKKYFLDLSFVSSLDDFLTHLKKKKRYNLRRDKKKILSLNPTITINTHSHLNDLFSLNMKRFRELFPGDPDEYSSFEDVRRQNVFRNLIANARSYQYRIISTVIEGRVCAVEFGLVHHKTYYAFNAGVDIGHYSGLGVFSNLLVIEDALNLGCTKIDFLEGDNHWKESWHLDSVSQYQFIR
ncbi:GNAT family N-acetyltransferase [Candidatus Gottesmanbacteria bacterium]|nr:GNAT family N-acetyltransferase [Candidatus Gottesmanbacteria bacterium]